jgi:two-component system sensor histidine kinase/response regulator
MPIRRLAKLFMAVASVLVVAAGLVVLRASANNQALVASLENRFESYQLADQIRRGSEDRTRFARSYAATGDPRFEQYYQDVLAIRNGQKPRPEQYGQRVYWDFIVGGGHSTQADGQAVSLQQLMRQAGFTGEEFAKILEAQASSDELLRTEAIALHAVKGLFADENGAFTRRGPPDLEMAVRILYDEAYHRERARVMKPIDEFLAMVDARTASSVALYRSRTRTYWLLIEVTALLFLGLLALSYPIGRRLVLTPIAALQQQTRTMEEDLRHFTEEAKRIAAGDRRPSFAVATTAIRSNREDEVGELTRLHDRMIGHLQDAGAAITVMTGELADAQRRLRDGHTDLLAVLDAMPAALVILDPDRSWRLHNQAAADLLGRPPLEREARLRYLATFSFRDKSGRSIPLDELPPVRALAGIDVDGQEIEVERPDGVKEVVLASATPLRDAEGRVTGAVCSYQDISRLRELDRLKDEFVAIASHELRTPLTAIRGSLQLVLADNRVADEESRELLAVGLSSCDRLVRIVNDMLDLSKMEAGKLELHLAAIDATALVERAVDGIEGLARDAGITVALEVEAGLPALHVDADRLTQALVNLLSNAIRVAPRGSQVTVSVRAQAGGVAMSVADHGPGIAADDIPRIFTKFKQLAAQRTRSGGTGLGLPITKAIVDQHGGTIAVVSTLGQGTTFTITVPAAVQEV